MEASAPEALTLVDPEVVAALRLLPTNRRALLVEEAVRSFLLTREGIAVFDCLRPDKRHRSLATLLAPALPVVPGPAAAVVGTVPAVAAQRPLAGATATAKPAVPTPPAEPGAPVAAGLTTVAEATRKRSSLDEVLGSFMED